MIDCLKVSPWLPVFFLVAGGAAWVAWQNRNAEKVRSAMVTGIALGLTGALITVPSGDIWLWLSIIASAALASIFFIALKEESKRAECPTIFIYDSETKKPLEALNSTYASRFCQRTISCPPEFIVSRMKDTAGTDGTGGDLYFDVLLRMIVDLLFDLYRYTWDLKVVRRFQYSGRSVSWEPHDGVPHSEFINREVFQKLFPESHALRVESIPGGGEKVAVPPGTKLGGKTELLGGNPHRRTLSLGNSYVKMTIGLTFSSLSTFGIGDLELLLGLSREEGERYSTYLCEINLSADFRRLKSGHPDMQRYRRWVDVFFEEIQENFDSRRHWERGKDWYTLRKLSAIKEDS